MTAVMRETVTAQLVCEEFWASIETVLAYDSADPFAVTIVMDGVEWLIARDTLRDGLTHPTGAGDVRIWPCHGVAVFLHLRAPSGEALLELTYAQVAGFLARTERLVPFGSEVMPFDETEEA